MTHSTQRPGRFMLADLSVILAIGFVLAALAAPGVVRLREASRRHQCMDNLHAIGIAVHNYHNDYSRLPPGWLGPNPDAADPGQSPNVGVLVFLLPYLGEESIHQQLWYQRDVDARTQPPTDLGGSPYDPPSNAPWWSLTHLQSGVSNLQLARKTIKRLLCPSNDAPISSEGTILAVHLFGQDGIDHFLRPTVFDHAQHPEAALLGRTNYLGVAGCVGSGSSTPLPGSPSGVKLDTFKGVFANRSDLTLGQLSVMDGTSNTLMFGESTGGLATLPSGREGRVEFSWFAGALPTYYGLPRGPNAPWHTFNSRHRAKVHFAFCDTSVRGIYRAETAIPYSPDWFTLQQLVGRNDGGVWE